MGQTGKLLRKFLEMAASSGSMSSGSDGITNEGNKRHALGEKGHGAEDDVGSDLVFALMVIVGTGTFFYHHLKVFRIPYTVIMFLYGGLLGCLSLLFPHTFDTYFGLLASVDPELLFHIFLPILIFEGAYGMKTHAFREVVGQVIILAGPGVAINTVLMGLPIKYALYPDWNWFLVALVASLLSATDPVSVVALLKDLGVDKRLTALVDGEAIMNDGTAIICFTLFLPAARQGIFPLSAGETILKSLQLVFLGIIFGCFCGWLQARCLHFCHNEPIVETFITVAFAFISFFITDEFLESSGVLALCVQGVYLSSRYPSMFPGKHGSMFNTVWHFLVHFANTIIFSIVGIIIVREGLSEFEPDDLWKLAVLYIVMICARLIMIFMLLPILNIPFSYKLTLKECVLLTHSGLRGAVAMTLALIVAKDSGVDAVAGDRVLFHTSGIVILTTIVNATTSSMAVAKLGHKRKDSNRLLQMRRAHSYMIEAGYNAMDKVNVDQKFTMGNHHMIGAIMRGLADDPYNGLPGTVESEEKIVNRLVMRAFKTNVWTQRDSGAITEKVVRVLARISTHCIRSGELIETSKILNVQELPWHLKLLDFVGPAKISHQAKVGRDQMFYGMLLAYDHAMLTLENALPIYVADSPKQMRRLHHWLQEERQAVTKLTHDFAVAKPESATSVVTSKGAEVVLRAMSDAVHELNATKGLSIPETEALEQSIDEQRAIVDRWDIEVPQPTTEEILKGCPLCLNVKKETIVGLLKQGTLRNFQQEQLVQYDEDSFGIIIRGSVDWLGRDGWQAGSEGLINIEGMYGYSRAYESALTAVSASTILFVPFKLANELAKSDTLFEETLQHQAACHVARHLLMLHHKYAEFPLNVLLTKCQRSGRVLAASSDHFQPTHSPGEIVCYLGGGAGDMSGVLGKSSEPMLLPRSCRLSYSQGTRFLVVGGTVEKALAARRRGTSMTGPAPSVTVPVFGRNASQYSDVSTNSLTGEELNQINAETGQIGTKNDLEVGLSAETSANQRVNVSSSAYSVENYTGPIPLINRYHVRFHRMLEELQDVAQDYQEFMDAPSRTQLLKTSDLILQQLTAWCLDFFQQQEQLAKQNPSVPLVEDHRGAHSEFLERVRVWTHGRRRGEMVHQSMLSHMGSFARKHFPEDKALSIALVKVQSSLTSLDTDLPPSLPSSKTSSQDGESGSRQVSSIANSNGGSGSSQPTREEAGVIHTPLNGEDLYGGQQ